MRKVVISDFNFIIVFSSTSFLTADLTIPRVYQAQVQSGCPTLAPGTPGSPQTDPVNLFTDRPFAVPSPIEDYIIGPEGPFHLQIPANDNERNNYGVDYIIKSEN